MYVFILLFNFDVVVDVAVAVQKILFLISST